MSGPVPSPSMKGTMGSSGTSSLPEVIVMGSPWAGAANNDMVARECTRKRASASGFDRNPRRRSRRRLERGAKQDDGKGQPKTGRRAYDEAHGQKGAARTSSLRS